MKAIHLIAVGSLSLLPGLVAQQASPAKASSPGGSKSVGTPETVQQAFQREQQSLAQDMEKTLGLDPAQLTTWRTRNASRLAAQQDRAKLIAAESSLAPMPELPLVPNIPTDASPALKDFLTARAKLARSQAQIHNELLDNLPQEVTVAQIEEMRKKEVAIFLQRNEGELKAQTQRAKAMSEESAQKAQPPPPPLIIPPGASKEMKAFMIARRQMTSEQIELWNKNPDPEKRDRAMGQWMKKNAARLEETRALAEQISE